MAGLCMVDAGQRVDSNNVHALPLHCCLHDSVVNSLRMDRGCKMHSKIRRAMVFVRAAWSKSVHICTCAHALTCSMMDDGRLNDGGSYHPLKGMMMDDG